MTKTQRKFLTEYLGECWHMTLAEEKELFTMVKEIYSHLGLDNKPLRLDDIRKQAEKDVLKFIEKRKKKNGND